VSNRIIGQFVTRLNTVIAGDDAILPAGTSAGVPVSAGPPSSYAGAERMTLALTALAGVALGLAIGRWADRLSCPPRRD
jgi:uncharacterized protein